MLDKYTIDRSVTDNSVKVENPEQVNVEIWADEDTFFVTCAKGSELYKSLMGENPCSIVKKRCNNYSKDISNRDWREWTETIETPVHIISINYCGDNDFIFQLKNK